MNKQFFIPIILMIFSLRYISLLEECFDYTVEIEIESTTSNGYMFVNSMFYAVCSFAAIHIAVCFGACMC